MMFLLYVDSEFTYISEHDPVSPMFSIKKLPANIHFTKAKNWICEWLQSKASYYGWLRNWLGQCVLISVDLYLLL